MSKLIQNLLMIVIGVAVYYVFAYALYYGSESLYMPEHNISNSKALISKYDKALDQASDVSKRAEELKTQYDNVDASSKDNINIIIPDDLEPIKIISEIDNIAKQNGIVIQDVKFSDNRGNQLDTKVITHTFDFVIKTDYVTFKNFLKALESSKRIYNVTGVSFAAPVKQKMDIKLKVETYQVK